MGDTRQGQDTGPAPGGPDVHIGTPGGKVGPRGKVEVTTPGGEVAGGQQSYKEGDVPDPNDRTGPAGDPAEGKRPGG